MANTVLSSLVAEVVFRVSPDKTADSTFLARILVRVNWAIQDIVELKEVAEFEVMDESIILVDSVHFYPKPTDAGTGNVLKLKTVSIIGTTTLRPIILRPILRRQYDACDIYTTGIPAWFFDSGSLVYLVPTPNAEIGGRNLRFNFIAEPPTVTDASATCSLQPRWDEAIVCGAAMKYLRDDGQFERAQAAEQDYMKALGIRRQKKSNQFGASSGRSIGLGRSASGYRGVSR